MALRGVDRNLLQDPDVTVGSLNEARGKVAMTIGIETGDPTLRADVKELADFDAGYSNVQIADGSQPLRARGPRMCRHLGIAVDNRRRLGLRWRNNEVFAALACVCATEFKQ